MKFLRRFFEGVQRDLRLFLFILLLLEIYRVLFIATMQNYMDADTTQSQIWLALWTGLRLSLKTAGAVTLFSFVFVTLCGLSTRLRLGIGIVASLVFSTLFMARFPYYRAFDSTFGIEVIRGMNDDLTSIIVTIAQEYGLFWRFPVALILTVICIAILSRLLLIKTFPLPELQTTVKKISFATGLGIIIIAFGVFVRFGGSFTYANGINWENAGITSDHLLNEAILDDGQAFYRVYTMNKWMAIGKVSGVEQDKIVECADFLSQRKGLVADNLAPYLEKTAKGEKIPKPQHIFIIMGETWMQWPMLGKYADLHVSEGIKSLIAEPNCYYSRNFMPNGDFTSVALTGMITGLPDVSVHVSYQPKSFEEVYISAMAPPLRELGYNVDFWYGGSEGWENMPKLALAQDFNNFYGFSSLNAKKQSVWGAKDEDLFNAIEKHLEGEPPTVHLIMTTSNHPPYNLNLEAEGFDYNSTLAAVKKLPNVDDPAQLTTELGHYWYMDKKATNFVRSVIGKYPNSLFIITGDHAVRSDPSTHPTIFEHQSVPFVMFGAGITKNILPQDVVGGHLSIVPTIIELIAPKDYIYYSIAPSLFDSFGAAFNLDAFVTQNTAGLIDENVIELLPHVPSAELNKVNLSAEKDSAKKVIESMRTVAWWILSKNLNFK